MMLIGNNAGLSARKFRRAHREIPHRAFPQKRDRRKAEA